MSVKYEIVLIDDKGELMETVKLCFSATISNGDFLFVDLEGTFKGACKVYRVIHHPDSKERLAVSYLYCKPEKFKCQ